MADLNERVYLQIVQVCYTCPYHRILRSLQEDMQIDWCRSKGMQIPHTAIDKEEIPEWCPLVKK